MGKLWHKFVAGTDGRPVLGQRPNAPIILWAVTSILGHFVHASPWHTILGVVSTISLAVWAIMEIGWGASYFRRSLGALVLAYVIVSRLFG